MKQVLITLLFPLSVFSKQQIKSKTTLESVIVYNNGAQRLSIGEDKKIIITKEKREDFSSTKFIGRNKNNPLII